MKYTRVSKSGSEVICDLESDSKHSVKLVRLIVERVLHEYSWVNLLAGAWVPSTVCWVGLLTQFFKSRVFSGLQGACAGRAGCAG